MLTLYSMALMVVGFSFLIFICIMKLWNHWMSGKLLYKSPWNNGWRYVLYANLPYNLTINIYVRKRWRIFPLFDVPIYKQEMSNATPRTRYEVAHKKGIEEVEGCVKRDKMKKEFMNYEHVEVLHNLQKVRSKIK